MKKIKKMLLISGILLTGSLALTAAVSCKNTVDYSFNVGGGEAIDTVSVEVGKNYQLPTPTRDGYAFEGWYLTANFTGAPVTEVLVEASATYYAKWAKLYTVTLDADGGTLSTNSVKVKENANLLESLSDYVPQKAGLTFGTWSINGVKVSANKKVTSDLSLKAEYKVEYTVEIYKQNVNKDGYDKADVLTKSAYVGETVTSQESQKGFKERVHDNTVDELTLSERASDNVFKHYFDRESYTVVFNSNYPTSVEDKEVEESVVYEQYVEAYSEFTYKGYCLVGWSDRANGDVVYKANAIESALFNGDGAADAVKIYPDKNMVLYAVWEKAYTDMFGNDDYIYLLEETDGDDTVYSIYLCRGDVFFKGRYTPSTQSFYFNVPGTDGIDGKLFDSHTFAYASEHATCTLYIMGEGLDTNTQITFDGYNGITYRTEKDGQPSNSTGTYTVNALGHYVAKFTTGDLKNQTLTLLVGQITLDGVTSTAFQIRNEKEDGLGFISQAQVKEGELKVDEVGYLSFDGFGQISYYDGSSLTTYRYLANKDNEDTYDLYYSNGTYYKELRLVQVDGETCYTFYESAYDKTYTVGTNETLTFDGTYNVTYTKEGNAVTGYYSLRSSLLGGTLADFKAGGTDYCFLLTTEVEKEIIDGKPQETVKYYATQKHADYAEFSYRDEEKTHTAPLLAVNGQTADLYGYDEDARAYVKMSTGSYRFNETTGLYEYTADDHFTGNASVTPWDLSTVQAFSITAADGIMYWYTVTTEADGLIDLRKQYKTDGSDDSLTMIGDLAIYTTGGRTLVGSFMTTADGLTTLFTDTTVYYFELNEEQNKFVKLLYAPYRAYALLQNGQTDEKVYVAFDGKGGATYTESGSAPYAGTVEETGTSWSGAPVWTFTSANKTFKYVQLYAGSKSYFAVYDEKYDGDFETAGVGVLTLDGYSYRAKFDASAGADYTGRYYVLKDNFVVFFADEGDVTLYFDLDTEENTFVLRADEYGNYLLINNHFWDGVYCEVDGLGKVTLYRIDADTEERKDIQTVSYQMNGDAIVFTYQDGAKTITVDAKIGVYQSYAALIIRHEEAIQTYVNEDDWSVVILDDAGSAVKYTKDGHKETGTYTLITDGLFYYVNTSGSEAFIYKYDAQNGTAAPIEFAATGYFTEDLEALLFTQYGFVIMNGESRHYYNIEEDGTVTLYRKPSDTETATDEYGFVHDTSFGSFVSQITFENKTYYKHAGLTLSFARGESAETKPYPLTGANNTKYTLDTLRFTPTGSEEFTVQGNVQINGRPTPCYVQRAYNSENELETYLLYSDGFGTYYFNLELTYNGTVSTYVIKSMEYRVATISSTYLTVLYYLSLFGSDMIENEFGELSYAIPFDENGEKVMSGARISATFGSASKLYDTNGELLSFTDQTLLEEGGDLCVEFKGTDNLVYRLYFTQEIHSVFGIPAYKVMAMARITTLVSGDYEVMVYQTVGSDLGYKAGEVFAVAMSYNGQDLIADGVIARGQDAYYVTRDMETNKLTYYHLTFTYLPHNAPTELEDVVVKAYETVSVTQKEAKTYYTQDGKIFVDILDEEGVMLMSFDGELQTVKTCEYDADTNTYTVVTSKDEKYTVKVEGDTVSIKVA